jgi:hypothetical protein
MPAGLKSPRGLPAAEGEGRDRGTPVPSLLRGSVSAQGNRSAERAVSQSPHIHEPSYRIEQTPARVQPHSEDPSQTFHNRRLLGIDETQAVQNPDEL